MTDPTPIPPAIEQAITEYGDAVRTSMAAHYLGGFTEDEQKVARQARESAHAALVAAIAAALTEARGITDEGETK